MTKTTLLYTSMIAVLIVGLWGVITYGQRLRAPHDIAGKWAVVKPEGDDETGESITVSQSGRYLKVVVNEDAPLSLHLKSDEYVEPGNRHMVFDDHGQTMTVTAPADLDGRVDKAATYRFKFEGPVTGEWSAKREDKSAAKTPATKPAAAPAKP